MAVTVNTIFYLVIGDLWPLVVGQVTNNIHEYLYNGLHRLLRFSPVVFWQARNLLYQDS